jgi:hypothetical protein
MTLAEMATYICRTVSQTEATDIAAAKSFLSQRNKMIYAEQMWPESLVEYEQTITSQNYDPLTSTWLPQRQVLLVAPLVALVVAIRTRDHRMGPQSPEFYYSVDRNAFDNSGTAREYRLLSPVVWDMDQETELFYAATEVADGDGLIDIVSMDDSLNETVLSSGQLSTTSADLGEVQTIVAVAKGTSAGSVFIGSGSNLTGFIVSPGGFISSVGIGINQNATPDYTILVGSPQVISVSVGDVLYFFDGVTLQSPTYTVVNTEGTLNIVSFVQGDITFTATAVTINPIVTLSPSDTSAPQRQRVQIIGGVADGTILRILGKRLCPALENDSDTPAVTGSENALIAFGLADLYRRERQLGKAQATAQEGVALLTQLVKEKCSQGAHRKRFIPSSGFGDANAFVGTGGFGGFPF